MRAKLSLSPFFCLCRLIQETRELVNNNNEKNSKTRKELEREREPIISFPHNNLLYISFFCA